MHRGEFVTTKEKAARYRPVLEAIHNGTYQLPGYAGGGYVTGAQYIPAPYEPSANARANGAGVGSRGWNGPPVQIQAIGLEAHAVAAETGAVFDHKARTMTAGYHR